MPTAVRPHIVNNPPNVIDEALDGFALTYPQMVTFNNRNNLISRKNLTRGKVGLVSGGGSGHEPLHAGFVGTGMLDVAVCGAVIASPTADQVHAGNQLAQKVCGALAERGAHAGTIAALGREVVARSRSLAIALDAGAHPGELTAAFELEPHEVAFGLGIHGERGTRRIPYAPADDLVERTDYGNQELDFLIKGIHGSFGDAD
jgi:dihydroxyacetone kinase-like protein